MQEAPGAPDERAEEEGEEALDALQDGSQMMQEEMERFIRLAGEREVLQSDKLLKLHMLVKKKEEEIRELEEELDLAIPLLQRQLNELQLKLAEATDAHVELVGENEAQAAKLEEALAAAARQEKRATELARQLEASQQAHSASRVREEDLTMQLVTTRAALVARDGEIAGLKGRTQAVTVPDPETAKELERVTTVSKQLLQSIEAELEAMLA